MVVVVVLMEQRNFWEAEAVGGVQEGKAALGASQGTRRRRVLRAPRRARVRRGVGVGWL